MATRRTISLDFDAVIHKYSKGWHDGTAYDVPNEGAFKAIMKLLTTHCVFIMSARPASMIFDWLELHDAPFKFEIAEGESTFWTQIGVVGITNRKFPAEYYIDDRAWHFDPRQPPEEEWHKALKEIYRPKQP